MLLIFSAFYVVSTSNFYTEIVPTRSVYAGTSTGTAPPAWPRLLFAPGAVDLIGAHGDVLVIAEGKLYYGPTLAAVRVTRGGTAWTVPHGAQIATDLSGRVFAVAMSDGMLSMRCEVAGTAMACVCGASPDVTASFGIVHAVVAGAKNTTWVGAEHGLFAVHQGAAHRIDAIAVGTAVHALAASGSTIAAATSQRLWLIDALSAEVSRWEWVTNVTAGAGGAIGDAITSLAFPPRASSISSSVKEPAAGRDDDLLAVGTKSCLNTWASDVNNGEIARIGAVEGLPIGHITALTWARGAPNSESSSGGSGGATEQLWVGTVAGVAVYSAANEPAWRYLSGPRWLAGDKVSAIVALAATEEHKHEHGVAAASGDTVVVLTTDGGVTRLDQQKWTLHAKAAAMEKVLLARHNRHGMVSECALVAGFGDLSGGCIEHDNDNNGLWTSLAVVAELYRLLVTGDPAAKTSLDTYLAGMILLNDVTATPGLMARSACGPKELAAGTCAGNGTWIHDKEHWHNSTAREYEGWVWKGDTSSDEVVGHV